ncbi:hypothetical protein I4U23_010591 [Adineta vaga]|nr:hypothetical protein I4U23_010591 [Adineta vaga]
MICEGNRYIAMTISRLEDLPNELWLEFFVYFTWSELNSTWLQWKLNNRIQLLTQMAQNRVALSLESTSFKTYGQCLDYFKYEHPLVAHHITSLLLNEPIVSNEIIDRWLENEKSFLPCIRKCIVYIDLIDKPALRNIILLIRRHALTLRHVVFYFSGINRYYMIMRKIIEERISLHTMKFIITTDSRFFKWKTSLTECATYFQQILTFPKTVRLRLSLQHMSDLALLMQCNTLPHIEDLHVTMETGVYTSYQLRDRYENLSCSTLCFNDLNTNEANLPHLRTLQLRQLAMSNIIVLIQHVKSMCQLESLILVNCDVIDKNELAEFKSCIIKLMKCLRCLRFVLYLPAETKLENTDLYWFNFNHHSVEYEINELLVLYTVPYLLNSQRQVYNHILAQQSTINNNINQIEWIIDRDPLSISNTLTHFQHVRSLALCFNIKQFRKCASALACLTLHWSDVQLLLKHSSSSWPFVRRLDVRLTTLTNIPSASLIKQLPTNNFFPQLQCFSLVGRRFSLNRPKSLVTRILICLDALVSSSSKFTILHVNKHCGPHRTLPLASRDIFLTLLTERVRSRGDHYSLSKIVIDSNEEIIIWL